MASLKGSRAGLERSLVRLRRAGFFFSLSLSHSFFAFVFMFQNENVVSKERGLF